MDEIVDGAVVNPSGLDSVVEGGAQLTQGVRRNALVIDGRSQWLRVTGAPHRLECMGDLARCDKGERQLQPQVKWIMRCYRDPVKSEKALVRVRYPALPCCLTLLRAVRSRVFHSLGGIVCIFRFRCLTTRLSVSAVITYTENVYIWDFKYRVDNVCDLKTNRIIFV